MTYNCIAFEVVNRVARLTLNEPETRNALGSSGIVDEIVSVLDELPTRSDVSVLVITGAGKAFCAGGNVKEMRDRTGMFSGTAAEIERSYRTGIQRIPLAMQRLDLPVIAAINGPAVGAGCDLAMMCDLRIGSPLAMFGESFVNLGLIPGDGGAWFLPRRIGHQRAALMTYTGRLISAEQALDWGLLLELVAEEALLPTTLELAAEIAAKPPQALRHAKQLLRAGATTELPEFLEMCASYQAQAHHSDEHAEAVAAFFEKRPGRY
ncbi:MAG: enoyl-CoA hydratase-related protein [Gammaproteobacteria bacterium]|nr:enoyl-CoA hydratase-related protein [Gammaproteobacteria bacterium]